MFTIRTWIAIAMALVLTPGWAQAQLGNGSCKLKGPGVEKTNTAKLAEARKSRARKQIICTPDVVGPLRLNVYHDVSVADRRINTAGTVRFNVGKAAPKTGPNRLMSQETQSKWPTWITPIG
jgi:hypothetical protein